jgi:cytochrome c-type biogenesis protein CcmE
MKRILSLSMLALVALAVASGTTKISDLLAKADKHDGKEVTVVGKVKDFKSKYGGTDRAYFTCEVADGKDFVKVYGRGALKPEPKDGDKVEIKGTFRKLKKVTPKKGDPFEIKNEVDVTVKGKAPALKIVK